MRANAGGQLSPEEVIGRDDLIKQIWKVLEKQSVVLYSERRIGKTCVIKKMEAETSKGFKAIYFDLEQISSCTEFFELVYKRISKLYSKTDKTWDIIKKITNYFSQTEITIDGVSVKLPKTDGENWKTSVLETFKRIDDHLEVPLVLFFDELPMMIDDLRKREGDTSAMEMLDTLRAVRQETRQIRMVYTGSIGLHHVVNLLKKNGYSNEPINDMMKIDVPQLRFEDAVFLAKELILGEGIEIIDINAVARNIATDVDRIPYYIQHIIGKAALESSPLTESRVRAIISSALTDAADIWNMKHYLDRIKDYYEKDDQIMVTTILDVISGSEEPLKFDDIYKRVKASVVTEDRDTILELMNLICQDHYLIKDTEGRYAFTFGIIKRWWKTYRALAS